MSRPPRKGAGQGRSGGRSASTGVGRDGGSDGRGRSGEARRGGDDRLRNSGAGAGAGGSRAVGLGRGSFSAGGRPSGRPSGRPWDRPGPRAEEPVRNPGDTPPFRRPDPAAPLTRDPRFDETRTSPAAAPARAGRSGPGGRAAPAGRPVPGSRRGEYARYDARAEAPPRSAPRPPAAPDEPLRLSKRMADLGLCSRREADEYIERGWVKVDGQIIDVLGTKVLPGQKIELERAASDAQADRITVILNKPVGYVSGQAEDGYTPAVALIRGETRWAEDHDRRRRRFTPALFRGLAPAGRLDIDSTGLLVLTQDGRIARQLIGEDSDVDKEYLVRVEGTLSREGLALLNHGLSLDGEALRPAQVSWLNRDQLRFILREGKKRQIRRMCELVGLRVTGLKRIRIGRIMLGNLPEGQWRLLADNERFL